MADKAACPVPPDAEVPPPQRSASRLAAFAEVMATSPDPMVLPTSDNTDFAGVAMSGPQVSASPPPGGRQRAQSSRLVARPDGEPSSRPRLLDLFCGAGGAAMGYHRAGFDVVGVDINPQPQYPFEFHQADALTYPLDGFDAIHASPPCQRWSDLAKRNGNGDKWPDLIAPTRELLAASGLPWVIENVEGAPLHAPIMLCGTMFPRLRVLRHRLFESNMPLTAPTHGRHPLVFTHDRRKPHYGQLDQDTAFVQVTGGGNCTVANKRAAMGVPWMTGAEANEAIPPAYTEHIGSQLLEHLAVAA